ncbi:major capsid protein [Microviridae sp.]|nr:major capsid protein [Microviridae sp.]
MKSVMQHQFSRVPKATIPRSSFDRSHGYKSTLEDGGYLYPILVDEALPGDTFTLNMSAFARMATPIYPIMDTIHMCFYFFAIPNRLLWNNWEKFCGAQDDPGDSTDFTIPTIFNGTTEAGQQEDYFGIPPGLNRTTEVSISALPFRAYKLVWNEWFRDQNLQNSMTVDLDDGPDNAAGVYADLLKRGKPHDYFTSSLPWPQKGDSVDIPLGTTAPVVSDGTAPTFEALVDGSNYGSIAQSGVSTALWTADGTDSNAVFTASGLETDLTNATAATINQLRQAFQVQKLLERDARGGTRYTEVIRAHFGVTSPDARLQRPEFLGGGKTRININPVPQTSETDGSPQGNLASYATASANGIGFRKSFTEHCVILGLVCVTADLTYQQGIQRMWSRSTRYDFYWPALANIGEQAVLSREIFADGSANDDDVFGYQERFAEYRYFPSMITGKMRSSATGTLDPWHCSQDFATRPVLDDTFIEETPPFDRNVAVPSEPKFIFDSYFNMKCVRPMPLYGVPGNIDRF